MRKPKLIDLTDRKILWILAKDPEVPQSHVAEKVGISQPAVSQRIKKLKDMGYITLRVAMDIEKTGLVMARIDFACADSRQIFEKFKNCPHIILPYRMAGERNVSITIVMEDLSSIESFVEHHLRNLPGVGNMATSLVIPHATDIYYPLEQAFKRCVPDHEPCEECEYFIEERCHGCPASPSCRSVFWQSINLPEEDTPQ